MSSDVVYLEVVALRGTFRRAGFIFTDVPQVIECTPAQAAAIRAEHGTMLKVRNAKPGEAPVVVTLASLDARIAELSAENAEVRKANASAQARIAELEGMLAKARSDLAKATADIEALTAPAKPAAPEAPPSPKADETKNKPAKG